MIKNFMHLTIIMLFCYSLPTNKSIELKNPEGDVHLNEYSNSINFTEKRIHQVIRKQHLPAFAITVVDNQDIIYQKAFGLSDIENNISASIQTVFKLWSVAKVFTAIEIFREVEEGLVDLDDPLSEYLPKFNIRSRNNEDDLITVKSILAHRSGLPRNECVLLPVEKGDTLELNKFEKATSDCYMSFPVGYRYKYSNLGYDLLGRIIEQTRGEGFSGFMRNHLLYDLGMGSSTFSSFDLPDPKLLAKGYEYYKGKYYPMAQYDINSVPSGNLYSTIEDLSVFMKSVLNDEVFKNKETLSRMFTDHYSKRTDPEKMGLGWKTTKLNGSELMIWHDGGPTEGIGALIAILPYKKLGIAMIGNGTSFSGSVSVPFAIEIFNHLLEAKSTSNNYQAKKPGRTEVSGQLLRLYEGKYAAFGQLIDVKAKNNKLKAKIGGIRLDLIPLNETEFRITHWMDKIGLTKIFKPPFEFDKIKIEFFKCTSPDSCYMIINLDNLSFEICPKYPEQISIPGNWDVLLGEYQTAERLPGNKTGKLTGRHYKIYKEDNVIVMSGIFGPIVPFSENCLVITSGPFAGETIEYYPESGNIIHQNAVFVPVKID